MKTNREYRFVVVGGGSAGCLIARILAERTSDPIALVEAGAAAEDVRTRVPAMYPRLFGSQRDWGFQTDAQPELAGRHIPWPRGKLLGGCGAVNALIYLQAAQEDFARWGWPEPKLPSIAPWATHGRSQCLVSGLPLEPVAELHPWSHLFLDAAKDAGLSLEDSMFHSVAGKCGRYHLTQRDAARQSTATQLQAVAEELPNLDVYLATQLHEIEFCNSVASAATVRDANGDQLRLGAGGELILAAGAVGSPLALMRSGIGPAGELAKLGIAQEIELPQVGQNLQDHLVYPVVVQSTDTIGMPRRFDSNLRQEYREGRGGAMASNIAEAGAIVDIPQAGNVQLHFTPTHYLKYPQTKTNDCFMSIGITPLSPNSKGVIHIDGRIDPRYLTDPQDLPGMVAAVDWVRGQIVPRLGAAVCKEVVPGRRGERPGGIEKSIRAFTQSIYHPTSTCRMGSGPENSVVDSQFRVHGIKSLRIADASVLPDIPQANTQAVTLYAAARCAELCLAGL